MPTLCFWAKIRVYCFRQWSKFGFWSLWSRAYSRSCNQDAEFALFFFFFFHCFLLVYRSCVDNPLYFCCWNFLFPSFRKPPKVSTDMEFGMHAGQVCQNFEFHPSQWPLWNTSAFEKTNGHSNVKLKPWTVNVGNDIKCDWSSTSYKALSHIISTLELMHGFSGQTYLAVVYILLMMTWGPERGNNLIITIIHR